MDDRQFESVPEQIKKHFTQMGVKPETVGIESPKSQTNYLKISGKFSSKDDPYAPTSDHGSGAVKT